MASVTLSGINKWYGGAVHAVRDISFKIEDGEFFGLLGPSGSGKTSVLRMLAGLERPTSGTISFDGTSVEAKTPQDRNVAMVFEQNALYPHMSARQNISYPLKIRGLSKSEIETKVAEVAALLNIGHLIDRRASQMSGGQQQRVAIARALVRRPNLLCLDEPIAHLDTLLRARLRGELKRLQRALGTTSVIVTHDPIEAMTMTDRIAVMRDGLMQQIGTADEIYMRPVNAFVAQFFGLHSMNVFTICDVHETPELVGQCGQQKVILPDCVKPHVSAQGRKVQVGSRPGGVSVYKQGEAPRDGAALRLSGRVYVAEQLGDAILVTVQAGDTTIQAMTSPQYRFGIDEPVDVVIREDALYVFDGDDQRTLRFASGQSAPQVDRMASYG
ncbi:ABC-type sugar transport system ATPase subunit [Pararhizobium capsulatum DSM 1112]|uniref:ABC-type sugar transport system ATPase subunit n=1 Tax=Pararhizobium capsulatum DSM 1112 TaxID=1121113 RepID=A0ABU0BYD3_9HYPH|nr:ABC transporter ATP-binding protein [Pararhizobium capsulatum]MDQ0323277.1 ABC-type sugar transport system ATPase subunit [Pararhizobium capsulatum DSM 1112]